MARLEIAIAEFAVVGAIAATDSGGLDSDLELIGCGICDGSSFLIGLLAARSSTLQQTPTNIGRAGYGEENGKVGPVSDLLPHARQKLGW